MECLRASKSRGNVITVGLTYLDPSRGTGLWHDEWRSTSTHMSVLAAMANSR